MSDYTDHSDYHASLLTAPWICPHTEPAVTIRRTISPVVHAFLWSEHVFADQKSQMGVFIRTAGIIRATMKIGLANAQKYLLVS